MHIEQVLESYAYSSRIPTSHQLKLLLSGIALIAVLLSASPVVPAFIFVVMSGTIVAAGVPLRVYLSALAAPLLFTLPAVLLMPFFVAGGEPLLSFSLFSHTFTATREGVGESLLLFARVLAGSASLFFVIFTTPMAEIFAAMRSLRVPALFVEMSLLIYRFLFVLIDEAERMLRAQKLRLGYCSGRRSLDSLALLASNLFVRSYLRAERAFAALETRGYRGTIEFAVPERRGLSRREALLAAAFASLLLSLAHFTGGWSAWW
jgi:cobalt/nickel transport system permease protein